MIGNASLADTRMCRIVDSCKTQPMAQTFTNVLSGGGMKKEEKHQEIVLVVIKFIMILSIIVWRHIPKTLYLSKYFILIFLSILAYQEKLGNEKEPCINHDSCKIGDHCGKSNCVKIINYQKISFDCCEKCKKLRNFSIL